MPLNPSDPEFIRSSRPASAYANRAYVTVVNGVARLAFGDAAAGVGDANYHTAVSMTPADAVALAETIYRVINEVYPPVPPSQPLGAFGRTASPGSGSRILGGLLDPNRKPGG